MPRRPRSGTPGLFKKHARGCVAAGPTQCDCPWYGKYKQIAVNLARWSNQYVDPRRKQHAIVVLNRLRAALDAHTFQPDGEYDVPTGSQTLRAFIAEWREHYAKTYGLRADSLDPMLGVIDRGLGTYSLNHLAGASLQLERWLNQMQRERRWSDVTWNKYHQLLHALFVRAIKWRTGNVSRMSQNPMDAIERRVAPKRRFRVRIEENAEDRLFAACELIDQPSIGRRVLDWEKVAAIRATAAAGESQIAIAADFKIAPSLCCEVVNGLIWNPANYKGRGDGPLMRLRLMMAFDAGVRREEMLRVQLKHIDFNPVKVTIDGQTRDVLVIEVQSKGEKFTGDKEYVYAGTERLIAGLRARHDQLNGDPDAYVCGTVNGYRQTSFGVGGAGCSPLQA